MFTFDVPCTPPLDVPEVETLAKFYEAIRLATNRPKLNHVPSNAIVDISSTMYSVVSAPSNMSWHSSGMPDLQNRWSPG